VTLWVALATAAEPELASELDQIEADIAAQRARLAATEQRLEELRSQADGGRVVRFGEPVEVGPGERVAEVVAFGQDVDVEGHVLGDAVSFGGDVRVGSRGQVEGDAVSFGGEVQLFDGAAVKGRTLQLALPVAVPAVEYVGAAGSEPSGGASEPAAASGALRLTTPMSELFDSLYRRVVWILSVAGAGMLVVGLFPQRVSAVAQDLEARPIRAAVVGTLSTGFLLLFSVMFTAATLGLGSPVAVLLVLGLGFAWLLGFVGLCQAVGDRLPVQQRPHGRWIALLVGVLLVSFLGSLPWVGWMVVGSASVLGIGAALSTRFGSR
jgi:hypothetical protein